MRLGFKLLPEDRRTMKLKNLMDFSSKEKTLLRIQKHLKQLKNDKAVLIYEMLLLYSPTENDVYISQDQLSMMLSCSRPSIALAIKILEKKKLIKTQYGQITINR